MTHAHTSPSTDVLGIGLNATDTVVLVGKFPPHAGKVPFSREFLSPGGQVATAVVSAAALGLKAAYIGSIGDDERGAIQRESLLNTGVDVSGVITRQNCPNQTAYIVVDSATGERTVLWQRAECLRLRPEEIDESAVRRARFLHVDGCDTEACAKAAAIARSAGVPVSIDVDTVYPGFETVLRNIDYLIASSEWTREWTGEPNPLLSLPHLARQFHMRVAAMTLGRYGSIAYAEGRWIYSPAFEIEAKDTTGAGDVFHGAFAYAILCGFSLPEAFDFSNAAAAINCTAFGARGHIPTAAEVNALLEEAATGHRRRLFSPELTQQLELRAAAPEAR